VHPRTAKNLAAFGLDEAVASAPGFLTVEPMLYGETIVALREAGGLLTDSGGVQKEAYFFGVPCVTLRDETEWVETVEGGRNVLAGADEERILAAVAPQAMPTERPGVYSDGRAAEAVVRALEARFPAPDGGPVAARQWSGPCAHRLSPARYTVRPRRTDRPVPPGRAGRWTKRGTWNRDPAGATATGHDLNRYAASTPRRPRLRRGRKPFDAVASRARWWIQGSGACAAADA
jgi:hypothetical protein